MKKSELIEFFENQISFFKDQNNVFKNQFLDSQRDLRIALAEVSKLTKVVEELNKQKNQNKGLVKLLSNESEKVKTQITPQEQEVLDQAVVIKRKNRGNNQAKRATHPNMETIVHTLKPQDPDFDETIARIIGKKDLAGDYIPRKVVRYECVRMKFIKHEYHIYTYSQNGKIFEATPPKAAFF